MNKNEELEELRQNLVKMQLMVEQAADFDSNDRSRPMRDSLIMQSDNRAFYQRQKEWPISPNE